MAFASHTSALATRVILKPEHAPSCLATRALHSLGHRRGDHSLAPWPPPSPFRPCSLRAIQPGLIRAAVAVILRARSGCERVRSSVPRRARPGARGRVCGEPRRRSAAAGVVACAVPDTGLPPPISISVIAIYILVSFVCSVYINVGSKRLRFFSPQHQQWQPAGSITQVRSHHCILQM